MKRLENCSDEELMVSYAKGGFDAFQQLYERHSGKVLGFLLKRIAHSGEAEDLMQTVFLKLHVSKERYEPEFPFLVWLFTITRNTLIDFMRRKKSMLIGDEKILLLADQQSESHPAGDFSERELKGILNHLPEAQREILEQRFSEGLSFQEIAKRTGITEQSVRKRVSRAVKKIRGAFK